jgi:hypothetical protein
VGRFTLWFEGGDEEGMSLQVMSDIGDLQFENALFGWAYSEFDFDGQYKYTYTYDYNLEDMTMHLSGDECVLDDSSNYEGTWKDGT